MARDTPRSFCEVPDDFGINPDATFREVSVPERTERISQLERRRRTEEAAAASAALRQHRAAIAIRHILEVKGKDCAWYGRATWPANARRMRWLLRGDIVMRAEDLAQADFVLGGVHRLMTVTARRARQRDTYARIEWVLSLPG